MVKQKGFVLPIILLLIGIGVIGYFGYQYFKPTISTNPQSTISPSPLPSSDTTANWKTYTNNFYKYSFKYPTDLVLENIEGGVGIVTAGTDTKDFQIRTGKIAGEYVDVSASNYFADFISPTQWVRNDVEIGGQKIEAYKNKKITTDMNKVLYRFKNQDDKIQVDFILTYSNKKSNLQETLTQILSTFKFSGPQKINMVGCSTRNPDFIYNIQIPQGWKSSKIEDDTSRTSFRFSGTNEESITLSCDTAGIGSVICINGGVVDYPFSVNNSEKDGCFWRAGGNGKPEAQFNVKNNLGSFVFRSNGVEKNQLDQILSTFKFTQ